MYGFFKLGISNIKMAKVMYALLITGSKLVNSHHISLEQYNRRQNAGNSVDVVVWVSVEKIELFQELAEVMLKTSKEFQGVMHTN